MKRKSWSDQIIATQGKIKREGRLQVLNVQRSSDAIIAEIEGRIASGKLADAEALPPERELMEQFGASRAVVREAIIALSNRGLVECRPRHRPTVRRAGFASVIETSSPVVRQLLGDTKGVKNLYDTRMFVEQGLVRNAALNADKDGIRMLKVALAANKEAIPHSLRFYETDIAFHKVFYHLTGNPVFGAVNLGFSSWLAPQWDRMNRSPERNETNYYAHQAIYLAILERDPDVAEEALIAHLKAAWEFVKTTFDDLEDAEE